MKEGVRGERKEDLGKPMGPRGKVEVYPIFVPIPPQTGGSRFTRPKEDKATILSGSHKEALTTMFSYYGRVP